MELKKSDVHLRKAFRAFTPEEAEEILRTGGSASLLERIVAKVREALGEEAAEEFLSSLEAKEEGP